MRQFDIHLSADGRGPYLLVLQSEAVNHFNIVVAAPLYPAHAWEKPTRHLQPSFDILGERFVLATNHLAAVPRQQFGEAVGSLDDHRSEILEALDFLFTGI
jgi:toxin CcdB